MVDATINLRCASDIPEMIDLQFGNHFFVMPIEILYWNDDFFSSSSSSALAVLPPPPPCPSPPLPPPCPPPYWSNQSLPGGPLSSPPVTHRSPAYVSNYDLPPLASFAIFALTTFPSSCFDPAPLTVDMAISLPTADVAISLPAVDVTPTPFADDALSLLSVPPPLEFFLLAVPPPSPPRPPLTGRLSFCLPAPLLLFCPPSLSPHALPSTSPPPILCSRSILYPAVHHSARILNASLEGTSSLDRAML